MKRITADNRREICDKERECLTRKQELLRGGCPRAGARVGPESLSVGIPAPGKKELLGLFHPEMKHHCSQWNMRKSPTEVGAEAKTSVSTNTI